MNAGERIPFAWRCRVAMRDVDGWGMVWHANYLAYCDEARAEMLRRVGMAPSSFPQRGYIAPVVEAHCRYHRPARLDDALVVLASANNPRGTRIRFDFAIRRDDADGELLAEVQTMQVLQRTNGDLVYLMPEELRTAVERLVQLGEPASADACPPTRGNDVTASGDGPPRPRESR